MTGSESFEVNGSADYDLSMIRDVLFVPNGINSAYLEENYVLTGYINDINTQYTQVLAEYGNSDAYTSVYEYGMQRTSMYQNGQVYSYEYDGRGSVSELVNAVGKTQIKYGYGAYGETVSTVIGWNNPVTNPYRYNAERIDDVAGVPAFQYLRARYLNPYTASFLTQDSYLGNLLTPLSQNRYAYAHNNPVMYTDSSGHSAASNSSNKGFSSSSNTKNTTFKSQSENKPGGIQLQEAIADAELNQNTKTCISDMFGYSDMSVYADDANLYGTHGFIVIENNSLITIKIGNYTLVPGESVTVGTWGNQKRNGVYYNLEVQYSISHPEEYNRYVSLTNSIDIFDTITVNTTIESNDSWSLHNNCSYFASTVWNAVSDTKLNSSSWFFGVNTPSTLAGSIKAQDGYETGRKFASYGNAVSNGDMDSWRKSNQSSGRSSGSYSSSSTPLNSSNSSSGSLNSFTGSSQSSSW